MVRDFRDRLSKFDVGWTGDLYVHHIALTTEQVEEFNPPPNPAKISDPRAKDYIREYGGVSWEVDALQPRILLNTLENSIMSLINMTIYKQLLEREQNERDEIFELSNDYKNGNL
jgi:hypothetical protein